MTEDLSQQAQNKTELSGFVRTITEPLSSHGWPKWLVYILGGIGGIYLLNPTSGIFELIPDVIPFVGNLDESVAVMLVLAGIVEALEGRKYQRIKKQTQINQVDSEHLPDNEA